ncbi:metallophosphoesterase [Paratissierella segnis]|jgi:hypothetical protein|uniref:Phosphoesterase n=1 Tax=Paratissierella segnis TaxID=2763679 RepID=A0A926ESS4_9FIRM|nr:metallophosphoesterase [Paratissierella segnis]MBC8586772.1 metallophosphoesterase [Paratissierella segnis]
MRIAVVSDTHGNYKEVLRALERQDKFDMLFHLGDYVDDGEKLKKILSIPTIIVKGNGDYWSDYNEDEIIEIKGKKILVTHGHRYNVRFNYTSLYYKGLELKADIVLFGHTHVPLNIKENNLIIMNPGSPSLPRSQDRKKTFGIIEIGDRIKTEIVEI